MNSLFNLTSNFVDSWANQPLLLPNATNVMDTLFPASGNDGPFNILDSLNFGGILGSLNPFAPDDDEDDNDKDSPKNIFEILGFRQPSNNQNTNTNSSTAAPTTTDGGKTDTTQSSTTPSSSKPLFDMLLPDLSGTFEASNSVLNSFGLGGIFQKKLRGTSSSSSTTTTTTVASRVLSMVAPEEAPAKRGLLEDEEDPTRATTETAAVPFANAVALMIEPLVLDAVAVPISLVDVTSNEEEAVPLIAAVVRDAPQLVPLYGEGRV